MRSFFFIARGGVKTILPSVVPDKKRLDLETSHAGVP
jgi:hypothetical protein